MPMSYLSALQRVTVDLVLRSPVEYEEVRQAVRQAVGVVLIVLVRILMLLTFPVSFPLLALLVQADERVTTRQTMEALERATRKRNVVVSREGHRHAS